jgi:C-8 sterol isomerase
MMAKFDAEVLGEIVLKGIGLPREQMLDVITEELDRRYPERRIRKKRRWTFSNAGGVMGMTTLLYGSLSEYILFFAVPGATAGHSGIFRADVWDFVMDGELGCYTLGQLERTVYKAGDVAFLGKSQGKGVVINDSLILEYARGFIPSMLPFGLADSIFSTLDFRSVWRQSWDYTTICTRELLRGKI